MKTMKTITIIPAIFHPLSYFPQGGNVFTPSPVGEGREGGLKELEEAGVEIS
jgi:hypothetical protein